MCFSLFFSLIVLTQKITIFTHAINNNLNEVAFRHLSQEESVLLILCIVSSYVSSVPVSILFLDRSVSKSSRPGQLCAFQCVQIYKFLNFKCLTCFPPPTNTELPRYVNPFQPSDAIWNHV